MARRVRLPGTDEIFRSTAADAGDPSSAAADPERPGNGRVRHDEKITVYLTSEQLHDLEAARLMLGRAHGIKVDRGRIVREAIMHLLADLETNGPRSVLVSRLRDR